VEPDAFARGEAILAARYAAVYDPGVLSRAAHLAGSDDRRAHELARALEDPEVRAVFCARGGYGALRIVDRLAAPGHKPVVGFSDITVLHAWLFGHALTSVHGPNVGGLGRDDARDQALWGLLENPDPPAPLSGLRPLRGGRADGRLLGGNLTVLSHLCGTRHFPDLRGAVLLLEDCNEQPYRIDRMLTQLGLSGSLAQLAGIALGDFSDCGDTKPVLEERLAALDVPVVAGLPVGHGDQNVALPHGARVRLDADAGVLEFLEGAVS